MNTPNEANVGKPARPAAQSILLWFDALALVIGAAYIVVESAHRSAVIFAYTVLCATAVLVRTLPSLKRKTHLRNWIDVLGLLAFTSSMTWGTGGVKSSLLSLLLLPLTAAAISLPLGLYGVIAAGVVVISILLAIVTPEISMADAAFIIWAISAFAPMLIATAAIAVLMEHMRGAEQYIQDISTRDSLTGLLNRRVFEDILMREHRKSERTGQVFCVVLVHVENSALMRESQGHEAANRLLAAVAASTSRSIRATDVAARYSEDELVVLLADTDAPVGNTVAQRIRNHVYAGTISLGNRMVRANVHIGMSTFPKDRRDLRDLIQLADQRMQHDKELHRPLAE